MWDFVCEKVKKAETVGFLMKDYECLFEIQITIGIVFFQRINAYGKVNMIKKLTN
jgi:hypothetical protein